MGELSEKYGINYNTLRWRLNQGMSIDEAIKPAAPNMMPEEDFRKEISKRNIELIGPYTGSDKYHNFKCNVCSHTWSVKANKVYRGTGCQKCQFKKRTKTTEQFQEEVKPRGLIVLGEYINNNIKIKMKCEACNTTWKTRPSNITTGTGCTHCGNGRIPMRLRGKK